MRYKSFLLALIFFTLLIGKASSQTANPDRTALRDALPKGDNGYSIRSNDQRYEGYYDKERGEQDFSVISLLKGKLDYLMSSKEILTIVTPKAIGTDSVFIAGISFNFQPDYRLDIHLKAGESAHVPVNAAIQTKELFKDNLGIYGYTGNVGSPDCYVPVEVRSSINNNKNTSGYVLTLISKNSVADVSWDYKPSKDPLSEPIKGKKNLAYVPERTPITIPLDFGKEVLPGSTVIVQIWGKVNGKQVSRLQKIKIIIPKT